MAAPLLMLGRVAKASGLGDVARDVQAMKFPDVSVEADVKHVTRWLSKECKRKMPRAIQVALNETGKQIREESKPFISRAFSNPKSQTVNATWMQFARISNLEMMVYLRETTTGKSRVAPVQWLKAQVYGGSREPKASEKRMRMSGRMLSNQFYVVNPKHRDGNGNITGGKVEAILSQLQSAELYAGYTANQTPGSKKKGRKKNQYFTISKAGRPVGVFVRKGKTTENVLGFMNRSPQYRVRLPFYQYTEQLFNKNWPDQWRASLKVKIGI